MRKILIIGDSSIPARKELLYSNTYSTILKNELINYSIEISAKTGNFSREININLEAFMLYGYVPDIVILNYGIVDVYPRPYPNKIYKLLACTGFLPYVDKFLKKTKLYYKLGNFFKFQEVNIKNFEINTVSIVNKLLEKGVKKIIIIGIIKPYKVLLKSRIANDEIIKYNNIYKKLSKKYNEIDYIDIYNDSSDDFTIWDGYHYSKKASKYIADEIIRLVNYD
ncbi:MAG: hypothetical protein DRG78_03130 [Epsilonproteobacteria bacterium]|nr:MAG: hypothetical protein DRG78_03130 [Campylobacterota bacterium]